jgi:hypothetical protein
MAGVINRPVAADGIIAFQDKQNPECFIYFPSSARAILGETLESFQCSYYGIGKEPQWVQAGNNTYLNLAGGVAQGKARFDATKEQKEALAEEISKFYKIQNPQLVPAILKEVKAIPVFAQGVASLGGNSKYNFPEGFSVGESFNFSIDSGNSLFAQLIASMNQNKDAPVGPSIGINLSGKLDLYGEPFKAHIKADLKQVWEYTRDQVGVAAKLGWFKIGSEFDKIAQSLVKNNIIQIEFEEGRANSEFGLQLLETTKVVFEAINKQITSGEGMFKFEPNPEPQVPTKPEESWFASLAPWSVAVNMSFIRNSFSQSILFEETISFQGIYTINVHSSMDLGAVCGTKTKDMFMDVTLNENGCITKEKTDAMQKRISTEVAAKEKKIEEYEQRLINGQIDLKTYEALVAMLNTRVLTEIHPNDSRTAEDMLAEAEAYVYHSMNLFKQPATVPVNRVASSEVVFIELPYPFRLRGKIDKLWKQVTDSEWKNMLSEHWTDNGFHFYSRIRERGPQSGISTPSDLESEIMKGTVEGAGGNRYRIKLLVVNNKGEHLYVFYDYDSSKKRCELVTCTYTGVAEEAMEQEASLQTP